MFLVEKNPALARVLPYLLLILAAFIAYANIYHNEFLFDDTVLIVNNQFLHGWHFLPQIFTTKLNAGSNVDGTYYRPLQSLLYLIVFQIAGLSPVAFHLLNLALHAANACLVYVLGIRLRFMRGAVFLAALIWALHPVQVEAVTYMSATADTLSTLFLLLAMIIAAPDFSLRSFAASAPFVILALLGKETSVIAPLLGAGALYCFSGKQAMKPATYLRVWPWAVVVAIYLTIYIMIAMMVAPEPIAMAATPAPVYIPVSYAPLAALLLYAQLLLWPAGLHMEHDFPAYASLLHLPVIAGIVIALAAMLQILRKQSAASQPFSWGLLWFVAALLPVFCGEVIAYEHWLYLPSAGLFLGSAQSIALLLKKKRKAKNLQRGIAGVSVLIALILGCLTWMQNEVWRDPLALYSNVIASGEPAVKAHANLGNYFVGHGDLGKALDEYQAAVANSGDTNVEAQHNLGVITVKLQSGKLTDEALAHFDRALTLNPSYYPTLRFLADTYRSEGNERQAAMYGNMADSVQQQYKTTPQP